MAILFAATYPERTTALHRASALCASAGAVAGLSVGADGGAARGVALDRSSGRLGRRGGPRPSMAPSRADDERLPRWCAQLRAPQRQPRAPRAACVAMNTRRSTSAAVLPTIRVPTLVLHRAGDRDVERRRRAATSPTHIPGREVRRVAGRRPLFRTQDADDVVDEIEEFLTGDAARRPIPTACWPPSLFTDIVGSTATRREDGRPAVDGRCSKRTARWSRWFLERFRGHEVDTAGRRVLRHVRRPGARDPLRARRSRTRPGSATSTSAPASHTGEVEMGDEAGAASPSTSARASMGEAGAGEVLVSQTVKDLVAGSGLDVRGARAARR